MSYASNGSLLGTVVKVFIVGLLVVLAAKALLAVGGVVLGVVAAIFGIGLAIAICLAVFGVLALFFIGPFLLVGWLALQAVRFFTKRPEPEW